MIAGTFQSAASRMAVTRKLGEELDDSASTTIPDKSPEGFSFRVTAASVISCSTRCCSAGSNLPATSC